MIKLKTIALLGVAFALPIQAHATNLVNETYNLNTPSSPLGTATTELPLAFVAGQSYDFVVSYVLSGHSAFTYTQQIVGNIDPLGVVSYWTPANSTNQPSSLTWTASYTNLAGKYIFTIADTHGTTQFNKATISGNFAAVPGPIAGAGLPALAGLLGFVAYRRKRSKVV